MDPRHIIIGGVVVFSTVTVGETWNDEDEMEPKLEPHSMEKIQIVLRPTTEIVVTDTTSGDYYDAEGYLLGGLLM